VKQLWPILWRQYRVLCTLGLVLLSASCERVTSANYNKLEIGMTYDAVVKILGQPEGCETLLQAKSCTWGKAARAVNVKFVSDKVLLFSSKGL
jgi:hypothetical protein